MDSRRYSSTKFTALSDAQNIATSRRSYIILITIVTVLFCMTCVYFLVKTFVIPDNVGDGTKNEYTEPRILKFYNPKPFLSRFVRKAGWENSCEESQPRLQAIPEAFVKQLFEQNFENISDYVNLDLLLHYENLISENRAANLKTIFNEYHSKLSLVRSRKDFINFLKFSKSNRLKFYSSYLKPPHFEVKHFGGVFALTDELNHWYNYLSKLDLFLAGYEQQKSKNFLNFTETNLRGFVEDTQRRLFYFDYPFSITEKKKEEISQIISEWAKPINIEISNSSVTFHNKILLLSDLKKQLNNLNISVLKTVYFFASHTIYLDDDLELSGVNLAMIAPKWVFIKRTKINLSGPDGRNITSAADLGQPGAPGRPGGNAGDFLGVGNPHEKYLLVTANGGRGGNGQDGAKGRDGSNNTQSDPPVGKPMCSSKVDSFKNPFGQVITHYKIFGRMGCGGSGTDGGVGGEGGVAGRITLIGRNSIQSTKGSNGLAGTPGRGGPGGVGGRDGCFYEVLDVDDETLYRVTTVKCPVGNTLPNGHSGKDNQNAWGQILPPAKENLSINECVLRYIRFVGDENSVVVLRQLLQFYSLKETGNKDIIIAYKLLEALDKIELYELFIEQIDKYKQPKGALRYLKAIILGRMTFLKQNNHFYPIDYKNYINSIKNSIKHTNEHTRVLEPSLYLKQKLHIKREVIKQNLKRIEARLASLYRQVRENLPKQAESLCEYKLTIDVMRFLLNETLQFVDLFSFSCSEDNRTTHSDQLKKNFLEVLENLMNKEDIPVHLVKLKDALCSIKNPEELSNQEKIILEALTDELEHFIALSYSIEWEESENLFLESLNELDGAAKEDEGMKFLKKRLVAVLIDLQYSLAADAARQTVPPSDKKLDLFQNRSLVDDVLTDLSHLEDETNPGGGYCGNKLKAVFDRNSAAGEFYFWPNEDIRKDLRILFFGGEINLKSNLINRHVFEKNFLYFTFIKLEFECIRNENECQKQLDGILANFKIKIIHSGYSYYNWKDANRCVVSEKVSLVYSFRTRDNNEPEIYNTFFKNCQDGELRLSPFTTWTVRLLPLTKSSNFSELSSYADKLNLRLTGSGIYTS